MAYPKIKGSIILKLVIVILVCVLAYAIYLPKKIWNEEQAEEDECRFRLLSLLSAQIQYFSFNSTFADSVQKIEAFADTNQAFSDKVDSLIHIISINDSIDHAMADKPMRPYYKLPYTITPIYTDTSFFVYDTTITVDSTIIPYDTTIFADSTIIPYDTTVFVDSIFVDTTLTHYLTSFSYIDSIFRCPSTGEYYLIYIAPDDPNRYTIECPVEEGEVEIYRFFKKLLKNHGWIDQSKNYSWK